MLSLLILILLGVVSLGILGAFLSLWLVGRWFRAEGVSWRRVLIATLIMVLLGAAHATVLLALENVLAPTEKAGSDLAILGAVLVNLAFVFLIVKRTLRVTFRRAVLPYLAFLALQFALSMALDFIAVPIRSRMEAFGNPTHSMAPTLLGHHTTIVCKRCGAVTTLGIRTDSSGRPTQAQRERAVSCSRCGGTLELPAEIRVLAGDRILVDKTATPARWDLLAFRPPIDPELIYIKRLVGLPRETVEIAGGEVFIDGKLQKKAPGSAEEMWIPVHEDEAAPAGTSPPGNSGWQPEREPSSWKRAESGWAFDGMDEDRLIFEGLITDWLDYNALSSDAELDDARPVGDVQVECTIERWDGTGSLGFEWERSRSVRAEVAADGTVELRSGTAVASGKLSSTLSGGLRLAFSVRDGQAYLSAADGVICILDFGSPDIDVLRNSENHPVLRLAITGRQSSFEIRRIIVRRDIYYREDTGAGAVALHPGEYFVLGDNPVRSADSRHWGPVPAANSQGVVRLIFWPFGRIAELSRQAR